jgi:iron(III) transport system substrate-binding protein
MVARSSARPAAAGLLWCLAVIAVGFSPGACTPDQPEGQTAKSSPPARLVIITPHSPLTRELFNVGFSYWHYKKYGTYADIHWLAMGTVECLDYINHAASEGPSDEARRMPDLMFGGGITEHALLAERGQARPIGLQELATDIPETVQGLPTRDPQGRWQATALSSFGIIYHKQACAERKIPVPVTWADLARPEYYGWVSMADPMRSGSNRQCLTLILQSLGWEEGWAAILRMAANSRALLLHSSDVINNVSAGVSLVGLSVSFSAMQEIESRGADRLAYLNPPGATAITPDLITVLNGAAHPELATRFLEYCLSDEGQKLWGFRAEERQGYRDTLYRYPVRPAIYETYGDKLALHENPLTLKADFRLDIPAAQQQSQIVAPLLLAACGDNHILLQECWKRIIDAGLPPETVAELTRVPFDEKTAYELGVTITTGGPEAEALQKEWSAAFRAKYEQILSTLP